MKSLMHPGHRIKKLVDPSLETDAPGNLWGSGIMPGPVVRAGKKHRETSLIVFVDAHSRLITHARFYLFDGETCLFSVLGDAILKTRRPRQLWFERGFAISSSCEAADILGISVMCRPHHPTVKAVLDTFFKKVRMDFISAFKGESLAEINQALSLWLEEYPISMDLQGRPLRAAARSFAMGATYKVDTSSAMSPSTPAHKNNQGHSIQ